MTGWCIEGDEADIASCWEVKLKLVLIDAFGLGFGLDRLAEEVAETGYNQTSQVRDPTKATKQTWG